MTLRLIPTTQFKKDHKRARKRGLDLIRLNDILVSLCNEEALPERYRDHALAVIISAFVSATSNLIGCLYTPLMKISSSLSPHELGRIPIYSASRPTFSSSPFRMTSSIGCANFSIPVMLSCCGNGASRVLRVLPFIETNAVPSPLRAWDNK